jgi:hypothetical protein
MTGWRTLCAGAQDLQVEGDTGVLVTLGKARQHRVTVVVTGDAIELRAVVARRSRLDGLADPQLATWHRNRAVSLVGFRVDERGTLVGESWVPTAGLTAAEFLIYVRGLAAACDLFEFQLTGRDRE